MSSPVFIAALYLVKAARVDDPINAAALHTSTGMWGLIAVGIFDNTKGFVSGNKAEMGKFFGYQICGMVVILAWTFVLTIIQFSILKKVGILRVSLISEIVGCDYTECGKPFPTFITEKSQ